MGGRWSTQITITVETVPQRLIMQPYCIGSFSNMKKKKNTTETGLLQCHLWDRLKQPSPILERADRSSLKKKTEPTFLSLIYVNEDFILCSEQKCYSVQQNSRLTDEKSARNIERRHKKGQKREISLCCLRSEREEKASVRYK